VLIFGVDIPLIEVVLGLTIITLILLVQAIVLVTLLVKQQKKSRELVDLVEDLSRTVLSIKKVEVEELDRLKVGRNHHKR
jgi:hypothetical protein